MKRKTRFVNQLESGLQRRQHHGDESVDLLKLEFVGCLIEESDVSELQRLVPPTSEDIHLSLECCRLGSPEALVALQDFCSSRSVTGFNFSVSDLHVHEASRLVAAAKAPSALQLSLRYQPGSLGPVLQAATLSSSLHTLELNARFPLEHRVRVVCLQEVVMALVPLQNLQHFSLTECELDDEGLALVTGGLLALQHSLQSVRLQTNGTTQGGLSWQSLPLLAHFLTELPHLASLDLELTDCRRLLQHVPAQHLKLYCQSVERCAIASVRLAFSNVGWTEDSALQVLEAAAFNTKAHFALRLQDHDLVQTERFPYHLATHLPQMQSVLSLQIVDDNVAVARNSNNTDDENPSEATLWDVTKQDLLVEALHQNHSIQCLELLQATTETTDLPVSSCLDEAHDEAVQALLQRNQKQQGRPKSEPSETKLGAKRTCRDSPTSATYVPQIVA